MEIASGMHRIACRFADRRMAYVHLLVGTQAALLMDTGCAHNPPQALLLCHNLDRPWVEGTEPLIAGRYMQFDAFSPAHWPVQRGSDMQAFFYESCNYCLNAEKLLLDLAQKQGRFTLKDAIEQLGHRLEDWFTAANSMLMLPLGGNLARLTQRGHLAVSRNTDHLVEWSLA
jgi:hypothetical protein